jgi:predicted transcriptional regulator
VKEKKPIQILRERRGGTPKDILARRGEQRRLLKRLRQALADGPRTVPEVAAETGVDSGEVLWHLMALKKYGELVEGEERDCYFEYSLKEDEA